MQAFNLTTIDTLELAHLPKVPASEGPRNEEDSRVLALVLEGMSSGPALPLDEVFFAELDAIVS
ncbi:MULTISPECIES: hypothetical protein [unclassified Undibacterium]|uniref:hypothetical protein n=1 Tax=unclassified Undibacterium TaxID=2630295 RepID=UPI002AC8AFDD|nr:MULTISPECIES: hypothetical protein [unclassified Undibacterium]MEB0140299.1 hypothetical protein [Undibacterium sp. CCC2.1]MEB0173578.1 hypothetical protein [Undibacterium sp. CCC1.1]MEB0177207.1 hypothetical protein [Undibacterium sp. CCC3.4]MEB0216472.1 hypothetical protein [Undibacterium sp. 5I2]WPX43242.1 hypothetical protein RHM61_17960 [Undibacterium sp. CCC3.4]